MSFILGALFGNNEKKEREIGYSSYYHFVVGTANKQPFSDRLLVAAFEDASAFCQSCSVGEIRDIAYCQQMVAATVACLPHYINAKAAMEKEATAGGK